jgi:hypothetical protein
VIRPVTRVAAGIAARARTAVAIGADRPGAGVTHA